MNELAAVFGLAIALVGGIGMVSPQALGAGLQRLWRSGYAMAVAVGIRLALGIVLIAAAPETRFPMTIRALGVITLIAAVALPLLGRERLDRMLAWWTEQPLAMQRGWCAITLAFGAFVAYAAV